MVLTLIVASDSYCILPSQSPKGDSSPRGRAKSVCEFENSSTNGNLKVKSQFIELFTKLVKTLASPMGEVPRLRRRGQ